MKEWKTFCAYIRTSIRSSVSLRESFFLQSLFMLISNIVFFSFWWIYFSNFSSIKGWTFDDMACLYGVVTAAYGLFSVFLGGSRYLARIIFEADLDALLVKPKNVLFQVMGSKSVSSGWGDILSSLFFFMNCSYLHLPQLGLVVLFILTACMVITSFSIIMGSLAFWINDCHLISKQIFEFLLTFSNYPKSIYIGTVKCILLTIIPSGFIGFLPIETIRDFSIAGLLTIIGFSILYLVVAACIFYQSLKRYTSGNKLGFKI